MDSGLLAGFITLGGLMITNIVIVAYSFGSLKQQVKGLGGRVERLEDIQNGKR